MNARGRRATVMTTMLGGIAVYALSLACGSALATAHLPDGRAWEVVSPLDKNGGEINGIDGVIPNGGLPEGGVVQASAEGGAISYVSLLAFAGSNDPQGAPVASQYLSDRGREAWLTENITTRVSSRSYALGGAGAPYRAFSSDLSRGLMLNGTRPVENPLPPFAANAPLPPRLYQNYYLRDNSSGQFEALLTSAPLEGPSNFYLELLGVTADLKQVIVGTEAALAPEATRQERGNLYEWREDWPQIWQPINVLPGAVNSGITASGGALLGSGGNESRTISNDGSRVFWSQPKTNSLFVREGIGTPQVKTVRVDATQGPDPSGLGVFKTASSDGAKVFFADRNRLTSNSTAIGESAHPDLYLFYVDTGQLIDLTIDGSDLEGASVLGVLEASEDGSYVYFVAEGGLPGTKAIAGNDNLYVWHETAPGEGTSRFIAALSSDDSGNTGFHEPVRAHDWASSIGERSARLTSDGQHLVFMSDARLTSYDNRDAHTGAPYEEVYLYDAMSGGLTCVSCNPSGARPTGPSGIAGGTPWRSVGEEGTYQSRVLSVEGRRVFFDSYDQLVPWDTNGAQDVYEWEQNGAGTCRSEGGCVFLLSGATSTSDSSFVDASANGSDAFFITRAQLAGQDTDQLRDVYDARVGGGFPSPPPPALPCGEENCLQSPSSSSVLGVPASATFSGMGNLLPTSSKVATKVKAKKRSKLKKYKKYKKHKNKSRRKARGAQRRG
jgi:hypothetical protein